MHKLKFRLFLGLLFLHFLCTMAPAFASYSKVFFGFKYALVFGVLIALPSGLLCAISELIGIRYRPPPWLGWSTLILVAFGLVNILHGLESAHRKNFILLYFVPTLMSFALVSLLPNARWRLIATWAIALGITCMIIFKLHQLEPSDEDAMGIVLGGALISLLIWQIAYTWGQRKLGSFPISSEEAA